MVATLNNHHHPVYVAIGRGSMQSREGPDSSENRSINKETGEARQLLSSSVCLIHLQLSLNSDRPRQHAGQLAQMATQAKTNRRKKQVRPDCWPDA